MSIKGLTALFFVEKDAFIAVLVVILIAFFARWALVEYQRANIPKFMKSNEAQETESMQRLIISDSETGGQTFDRFSYKNTWFWHESHGYVVRGKAGWLSGVELLNRELNIDALTNTMLKAKPSPKSSSLTSSPKSPAVVLGTFSQKMSPLDINIKSPLRAKPSPAASSLSHSLSHSFPAFPEKANKVAAGGSNLFPVLQSEGEGEDLNNDGWISSGVDGARDGDGDAKGSPQEALLRLQTLKKSSPVGPVSGDRSLVYDIDQSSVSLMDDEVEGASVASRYYLMDWAADDDDAASDVDVSASRDLLGLRENQLFLGFEDEARGARGGDSDVKSVQSIESLFSSLASTISYK